MIDLKHDIFYDVDNPGHPNSIKKQNLMVKKMKNYIDFGVKLFD